MADQSLAKLITVSLGKIQQSKQAKHLNLRRSLLVASVLSQARTEYIAEIKLKRIQYDEEEKQPQHSNNNNYRQDSSTAQANGPSPRKRKFMSQRSCTETELKSTISCQSSVPVEMQTESNPHKDSYTPTTITDMVLNEIQTISEIENKENNIPSSQTIADSSSSLAACRRCLKRSLSSTDSLTSANTPTSFDEDDSTEAKRIKSEASSEIARLTNTLSNSFMEFAASTTTHSSNITSSQCGASMADFNCFAVKHHKVENTVALEA